MTLLDGWKQGRLGELCSIEIGGTPSRGVAAYWDSTHATSNVWVSIRDMRQRLITRSAEQISSLGVKKSNVKLQQPGTVLLSFKLSIGRVAIAAVPPLFTNEAIAGLSPTGLTRDFLFHGLQGWDLLQSVDQAIKGATLNKQKLKQILFEYPVSEREQAKIAEVLSTVDQAVEETEALIAKQQRIKTGLMQDLLTRGIDEHGNLRSEQTHKFKDSPLGRIPAEWDVAGLSTRKHAKKPYLKTGPFGSSLKISDWVEHGIPVITIGALGEGSFEEGDLLYVSMSKAEQLAAYALEPGDIVFSRVADVGRSVVVTERERDWIMSSNMMRISIDVAKADPNFLRLNIVKHPGVRAQIRQTVNASGREVANQQVLDALRFPWPSVDEQRRIVRTVAQQSEQIVREETYLAKFRRAKAGLMQDLLTGNRRVTALLEQGEGAAA